MSYSAFSLGGDERRTIRETFTQQEGYTIADEYLTNGHQLVPGDVVRHDGGPVAADKTVGWRKAQANTEANAEALGIVESVEGETFTVVFQGRFRTDLIARPLEYPKAYFLSATTPGLLVCDPPKGAGEIIKPMLLTSDSRNGYVTNYIGTVIGGDCTVDLTEVSPVGQILPFAGTTGNIPTGHFLCDGRAYSTGGDTNDLFGVIGYSYGTGMDADGHVGFRVPDLQGRFAVGAYGGATGNVGLTQRTLGASGGSEITTLAAGNDFDATTGNSAQADREITGDNIPPFVSTNWIIRWRKDARAVINCDTQAGSFYNKLINGDFDFWQRGLDFLTGGMTGTSNTQYTTDRWALQVNFASGTGIPVFPSGTGMGVHRGVFNIGQTSVPDYPDYYTNVIAFLTGSEGGGALIGDDEGKEVDAGYHVAYDFNTSIDGSTNITPAKTSSGFRGLQSAIAKGTSKLRTNSKLALPTALTQTGKKYANEAAQTRAASTASFTSTNLQTSYLDVAGPYDFTKKSSAYPANGRAFTIEGWFRITGAPTGASGIGGATGGSGNVGGEAPITLVRFGAPPAVNGVLPFQCAETVNVSGGIHNCIQIIASDEDFSDDSGFNVNLGSPALVPVAQVFTQGGPRIDITGNVNIHDGEFHHILFSRNNKLGKYRLFIDGVIAASGNASGNDPMFVTGATGGTGGISGGHSTGSTRRFHQSDMYVFGGLNLTNAASEGTYQADLLRLSMGVDRTQGLDSYSLVTSSESEAYRNFAEVPSDREEKKSFTAFTQRIEDVTTLAGNTDEQVTLCFYAKGYSGQTLAVGLRQCFGTNAALTGPADGSEAGVMLGFGGGLDSGGSIGAVTTHDTTATFGAVPGYGKEGSVINNDLKGIVVGAENVNFRELGIRQPIKDNRLSIKRVDDDIDVRDGDDPCRGCNPNCFNCNDAADCVPGDDENDCCGVQIVCTDCAPECYAEVCPQTQCCPADGGDEYTADSCCVCEFYGGTCVPCSDPPECEDDADCATCFFCDNGDCEPIQDCCVDDQDCPDGFQCLNNECVPILGSCCVCGHNAIPVDGSPNPLTNCIENVSESQCNAWGAQGEGSYPNFGGTRWNGAGSDCTACTGGVEGCCCVGEFNLPAVQHWDGEVYLYDCENEGCAFGVCGCGNQLTCDDWAAAISSSIGKTIVGTFVTSSNFEGCGCAEAPGSACQGVSGACCTAGGNCVTGSEQHCVGSWQGYGVPCDNGDCATGGACCLYEGGCSGGGLSNVFLTAEQCLAVSGTFHGTGSVCSDVNNFTGGTVDGQAISGQCYGFGTCCNTYDGTCNDDFITGGDCGGVFNTGFHCLDSGYVCEIQAITGACCVDGDCIQVQEEACFNLGGEWNGGDTSCETTMCCRTIQAQTITLSPTWKKYTLTFNVPSAKNKYIGTLGNDYLELNFITHADIVAGEILAIPGYDSNNTEVLQKNDRQWSISHVQLESGTVASDFDIRPKQIEKELCERFFEIRRNVATRDTLPVTGGMNHGSIQTILQEFRLNEHFEFGTEKKWIRPEVALLGLETTENVTGVSVTFRDERGFTLQAQHLTGTDNNGTNVTGYMHVTGTYVAIAELYTPQEEAALGYDFHPRNDPPPAAT